MLRYGPYIFGGEYALRVVIDDGLCSDHRANSNICVSMQRECKVLNSCRELEWHIVVVSNLHIVSDLCQCQISDSVRSLIVSDPDSVRS